MTICARPFIALFLAGVIALLSAHPAPASYNSKAARTFEVACRRLADLKKSPRKSKYRSYWLDSIRTFEVLEKKYAKSSYARDACFYRADIYRQLYQRSMFVKDIEESLEVYEKCQSAYPRHSRAPEALYRIIEISLYYKKNAGRAADAYSRLLKSYPRSKWTAKAGKTGLKHPDSKAPGRRRQTPVNAARRTKGPADVVKNIRYRSSGDYTRIVIDHKTKARFDVLELRNPPRLVFDFTNARLGPHVDKEPLAVNDGILRQVRASQYTPETVRVVLDLASIKSYAAFPLRDPHRLVIDVMAESADGPDSSGSTTQAQAGPDRAVKEPVAGSGSKLSLSRQLGLKVRTIAIDAGHGGRDPGAIGRRGTREKNITLDIAKRLAALVKKGELGCRVVMTRSRDLFIPLEDRPAIARTKGADLFVSIHVNANRRRRARGIETYIQGLGASDRDAMETAARENATSARTLGQLNDELAKILTGLRMESNDEDSIHLAHAVQGSLLDTVKPIQGRVADLGVKRAFFYVLINTGMPSILAEVGFISNPAEERLLRKGSYRQTIAEAIYNGLKKYVESRQLRSAFAAEKTRS